MGAALQQYAPIDAGTSARRRASADGIIIAELRFAPGARLPRHAHEFATITVTLEGSLRRRSTRACATTRCTASSPNPPARCTRIRSGAPARGS